MLVTAATTLSLPGARAATTERPDDELRQIPLQAVNSSDSFADRFAISHAGARGLMQVMPFWLDEIGRSDDDLFDIRTNLRMGCTILRHYLDRERGNRTRALARYNGSVGKTWYPQRVYKALSKRWYRQ